MKYLFVAAILIASIAILKEQYLGALIALSTTPYTGYKYLEG